MGKSVLFLGGSGTISSAVVKEAQLKNWTITLLNRGNRLAPEGVTQFIGDINYPKAIISLLQNHHFDVICDFITYTPKEAKERIDLFKDRCHQYIFISSATVYQKPPQTYLMTEDTPKGNPFWSYAQDKILCETLFLQAYAQENFPVTIVRPSYTYGDTSIPWVLNAKEHR